MPIYEYQCRGCGQRFELLVRGSEAPACPACESPDLEKLISAPAAPHVSGRGGPRCDAARGGGSCDLGGGCSGCPCGPGF